MRILVTGGAGYVGSVSVERFLEAGHEVVILDDLTTGTGFHITPFVGLLDPTHSPYPWRPHDREVAEVIEVPLPHLQDPANFDAVLREIEGAIVVREAYRFGDHVIWGATARMLQNFLEVIAAEEVTINPGLKSRA